MPISVGDAWTGGRVGMLVAMDALTDDTEEARLLALEALNVLDTPPEERFDRVTRLSTRLFGVPMAAVALVGRNRWVAKSRQNMSVGDIERADSFCEFTIRQPDILVIEAPTRTNDSGPTRWSWATPTSASTPASRWKRRAATGWARCASSTADPGS